MELSPVEWFVLLTEHAPKLRAAGVTSVTLGAFTAQFTPPEPKEPLDDPRRRRPDDPILDAMNDPETFGGTLPGYRLPLPDEEV